MRIENFKPVIVRVLSQSVGKKLGIEEVAERLIGAMQDMEAIIAQLGEDKLLSRTVAEPPKSSLSFATDISQRITSVDKVNEGLVEIWTKEQLGDFGRNQMPEFLQVHPPGFPAPFQIRKFIEVAPGDLGFVRIVYQQQEAPMMDPSGQRVGPTAQITTTDKRLDADELTTDIIKQAEAMYTTTPRVLTPKLPPSQGSPGDLRNALSAEAPGTGEEGFTLSGGVGQDGRVVLGPTAQQWSAQRNRG